MGVEFKFIIVRCLENGSIFRPLLVYVGVRPKMRIIDDLSNKKNEVNVILGKNQATGEKMILGLSVNED